jgi:uncharacterized protein
MIIDFHTHIFPDDTAKKLLYEVSMRAKIPYYSDGSKSGLLYSMNRAGVDISVISRVATKSHQVEPFNLWLKSTETINLIPMAAWHPDLISDPSLIEGLKERGFRCIKLHPDYQGFYVDEKRMFPFYEAAQFTGMPVLFHAGIDRGLPSEIHAPPERIRNVHARFPGLKIIAAHMGGEGNYDETEEFILGKDNIYFDTSFVLRNMPLDILERFLKRHPVERILFGSDSPWSDQAQELDYLMKLKFLSSDAKEKILGKNASELLGIKTI